MFTGMKLSSLAELVLSFTDIKVLLCVCRYEVVINRASVPVHRHRDLGTEHGAGACRRGASLLFGIQRVLACVQHI